MLLEKTVSEIIEEIEVLEKKAVEMFGVDLSDIADMDEETFKMMKSYFRLVNLSKELMLDQARMLDSQNTKLNVIESKLDALIARLQD